MPASSSILGCREARAHPAAADHAERGGFSGAVCAQDPGDGAIGRFERKVPDDGAVVEAFSELLDLYHVSAPVVRKSWNSLQGS
jgi:hypothetical protein